MTGKVLGKITSANFGQVRDYPFLFGLQLYFKLGDGSSIGTGSTYTINISEECKWLKSEREEAIANMIKNTNKTLEDAKINFVHELKNKPVEVEIDKNTFKDFRILTEVI